MQRYYLYVFLLLLFLTFINDAYSQSSSATFATATISINSTEARVPFDFVLYFQVSRRVFSSQPIVFFLPRFTQNLYPSNTTAQNISSSDLIIAPSGLFSAEWVEGFRGGYDYNYLPYAGSMIILRTKNNASIEAFSAVTIKVFKENGIGAHCGFPSFAFSNVQKGYLVPQQYFQVMTIKPDITYSNLTFAIQNYNFSNAGILQENVTTSFINMTIFRNYSIFNDDARQLDSWPSIGKGCTKMNQCNGHGMCDYCFERCLCYSGFGSSTDIKGVGTSLNPDCSSRVCPTGKAIADIPTAATVAHARAECSNHGNCNRTTGMCDCFPPFTGVACEKLKCPRDCSGHGQCVTISEYALQRHSASSSYRVDNVPVYYGTANGMDSTAWDYNTMAVCVCDSGWSVGYEKDQVQLAEYFGPSCSRRRCPSGDDPFTKFNETNCGGISQYPGLDAEKGKSGNLCHVDCSNRGICDYNTGICKCFQGSWGDACDKIANAGVHVFQSGVGVPSFWLANGNTSILVKGN